MSVLRYYNISVTKGEKCQVALPAMMSFWGATNEQVVEDSKFRYSVEPDSIEIHSDNRGLFRKYYKLTWEKPISNTIQVRQMMNVNLMCRAKLFTSAKLPYSHEILERFLPSLSESKNIDPDYARLENICNEIIKKANTAEEAVELVCDWINENIAFNRNASEGSNIIFETKKGNCTGMSYLACAMIRKIGVPCEKVKGKFIGSDGGHAFIEVYFPDAGWVFYDLSNRERGFKDLDCLITSGWAYWKICDGKFQWVDGFFCDEEDIKIYKRIKYGKSIRKGPLGKKVHGVMVYQRDVPETIKVRHRPIRELIMDISVEPGVREYSSNENR